MLAAAGAEVHVYAVELGHEMAAFLIAVLPLERCIIMRRPWALDCFAGAAIALADAETDGRGTSILSAQRVPQASLST